jgi:hypothetical protein
MSTSCASTPQITLLHIPDELIAHLRPPELNEIEREMVEAARTNFEESLAKPAVPALTGAEWLERVAFPLKMSEEGDLLLRKLGEGDDATRPRLLVAAPRHGAEEKRKAGVIRQMS